MQQHAGKDLREEIGPVALTSDRLMGWMRTSRSVNPVGRTLHSAATRLRKRSGDWIGHWSGLTPALREARCDLWVVDLGEMQCPQAPTVWLMRQSRQEQDPALAFLPKDRSRTHDLSSVTNLRTLHNRNPNALADSDRSTRSPAKWSVGVRRATPLIDPLTDSRNSGPVFAGSVRIPANVNACSDSRWTIIEHPVRWQCL